VIAYAWPRDEAAEALKALAKACGLPIRAASVHPSRDVERTAAWFGLEAEPVAAAYGDIAALLRDAGPALLDVPGRGLVPVLRGRGSRVTVIGPEGATQVVDASALRAALVADVEAPIAGDVEHILDTARVSPRRRGRARAAFLRERLAGVPVPAGWLLRPAPSGPARNAAHSLGVTGRTSLVLLAYAAEYALGIAAWWVVGSGALDGRIDPGWLWAWGLVVLSQIPLRLWITWSQGNLAIRAGGALKQRLLAGALSLAPDEVRARGAGQFLATILESEAIESLAINSGLAGLVSVLELVGASVVLAFGAGGALEVSLLAVWLAVTVLAGWRYFGRRARWTDARVELTNELVDQMAGHRTRLAQQSAARLHHGEDEALERYIDVSRGMDSYARVLVSVAPRGWILVGLVALAPWFVRGSAPPAQIAVTLGGVLLAYLALRRLVVGMAGIAGAVVAWRGVSPVYRAAGRAPVPASPDIDRTARPKSGPILEAKEIVFRYREQGEAVLRGCTLRVDSGDRILLDGGSGGGKSTLGALLAGLRTPASGLILLRGLDQLTTGDAGWRQHVAAVPQFHENHVLSGTFAFNLLMGRNWPPTPADMALAEEICRELDLGELIGRMPSGLQQMVGETGWQLSHGERSRMFMARALLQGAELLVLDESFAALDPATLERSLECVMRRADALVVIAHP
jgi:ATP-binding cassette subfamily B protein